MPRIAVSRKGPSAAWRAVSVLLLGGLLAGQPAWPAAAPGDAATAGNAATAPVTGAPLAAVPPSTHRPLRQNQADAPPPAPTAPETFAGYARAIPFSVVPQKPGLALFPCSQCHNIIPANPQPRVLVNAPHNAILDHGKGRLWCLNCHLQENRDYLHTIRGEKVDFNDAYLVCGQCHSARQKDWYFGGHGKRAVNWRGDRVLYNCTHCHDPHSPSIKPRKPNKLPPVRAGLSPMPHQEDSTMKVWERDAKLNPEVKP